MQGGLCLSAFHPPFWPVYLSSDCLNDCHGGYVCRNSATENDIAGNYEHIELDFADDRAQYFVKVTITALFRRRLTDIKCVFIK